jgi:6-phosphofructokinase 1
MKRIGVLTGGGDVPGLNPCIKMLVNLALDEGYEVYGIRHGWGGLLNYNIDDPESHEFNVIKLDKKRVRTVDRTGGTFLHSSRTNPSNVSKKRVPEFLKSDVNPDAPGPFDFTPHVLRVLEHLGIDVLCPIGGDDTLSYSYRMYQEGVHVVAIPKTMDNDVYGTDYCLGFSTAVSRSVEMIHQLRTACGSHERIGVVELFGRNSGETSLLSAYLAGVDRSIISEVPFDGHKLANFLIEDKKANPSNYSMVTISEGASMIDGGIIESGDADAYGHRKLGGIGQATADLLKKVTGEDMIVQQLSYLMRSGAPDSLDLMVSFNYAEMAVKLIKTNIRDRMVALRDGKYTSVPMATLSEGVKRVDVANLYDVANYRPRVFDVEGKPMFLY